MTDGLVWFAVIVWLIGGAIELIGAVLLPLITVGAWIEANKGRRHD